MWERVIPILEAEADIAEEESGASAANAKADMWMAAVKGFLLEFSTGVKS